MKQNPDLNFTPFVLMLLFLGTACQSPRKEDEKKPHGWGLSVLPASIRLDPVTGKIIESRYQGVRSERPEKNDLLKRNWVYDGQKVSVQGARGEYVSFQLILTTQELLPSQIRLSFLSTSILFIILKDL